MFTIDNKTNAIRITRGDTGYFTIKFKKYEIKPGDILTLSVKLDPNDIDESTYIINKSLNAIETQTFTILPSETRNVDTGRYFYDVQLTTSIGEIYTVLGAKPFFIKREVTRP